MLKVNRSRSELQTTKKIGNSDPFKNKTTHQEISKSILDRGFECASVLMLKEDLHQSIETDPKHCKITRTIETGEFERVVQDEAERHYPSLEKVIEILKTRFPDRVTNQENGNAQCHKEYRGRLERQIWRAYDLMSFAKVFWDMRFAIQMDYKEEQLSSEDIQKKVWDDLFSLMLPTVMTHRERIFPLCEPFNFWDERNRWQQWYLVDKGDRIDYACGGTASSWQREQHGKYAHAFSLLSQKGYEIPTYVFLINGYNELRFLRGYECFKVIKNEITGNYQVDWDRTKNLFKNRLLAADFSVSQSTVAEVQI